MKGRGRRRGGDEETSVQEAMVAMTLKDVP